MKEINRIIGEKYNSALVSFTFLDLIAPISPVSYPVSTLKIECLLTICLSSCSPLATNLYSGWLDKASLTVPDIDIPPGAASGCIREAILTPSPKTSLFSFITSPM